MKPLTCPCCGQGVAEVRDPFVILDMIHLSPLERAIMDTLAKRIGRWVRTPALVESVYGERWDGGPLTARNCISVNVVNIRKKLAQTPLAIETHQNEGRGATGSGARRLVWRSPQPGPVERRPRSLLTAMESGQ